MKEIPKVDILKSRIFGTFETFINDLLILCESEIEKQLLLNFVEYIFKDIYSIIPPEESGWGVDDNFDNWSITNINRIWKRVERIGMNDKQISNYLSKGYKISGPDLYKTVGIEFKDENIYNNAVGYLPGIKRAYTFYKLIPQFEVKFKKNYRLDFALLASHYEDKILKKESKVAIECDGYEYHSSKTQISNDNEKHNLLQVNGWKTYRLSGSVIYGINTIESIREIINNMRVFTK